MATGNYMAAHSLTISPLWTNPQSDPAIAEYLLVVKTVYKGIFNPLKADSI